MELFVVPQHQACGIDPRGEGWAKAAMIRITTDPAFAPLRFEKDFQAILQLRFADWEDGDREKMDPSQIAFFEARGLILEPISLEQAKHIVNFVEDISQRGFSHLVVHCQAGFSRSPAVAIAIAEHLQLIDELRKLQALASRGVFAPNQTVLRRIREVTGAHTRKQEELEQTFKEAP